MDATSQRSSGPMMTLVTNGALNAEHTARIADRLLAMPSRGRELQMLTQMWAQRQPHDATRWLLARGSAAPRTALGQAAIQLARTDPAAAVAYVDRVPPELRATWLSSVADGYAQNDARAAASWVAQHRGEPGYDAAVAAIAGRAAPADPCGGGEAVRLDRRRRGARRAADRATNRRGMVAARPPRGRRLGRCDRRRRRARSGRRHCRGAMGRERRDRRARLGARSAAGRGAGRSADAGARHDCDGRNRPRAARRVQQRRSTGSAPSTTPCA